MILSALIIRINRTVSDSEIIELLKLQEKIDPHMDHRSFDYISGDDFNGLGLLTMSHGVTVVVHRNLGYTCQFEGSTLYPLDRRIAELSTNGEVLCFMTNPYSATFGYAYFKEGARVANEAMAGGEILEGNKNEALTGTVELSENGLIALMERTGKFYYDELIEFPAAQINVYHPN